MRSFVSSLLTRRRSGRFAALAGPGLAIALALVTACSDETRPTTTPSGENREEAAAARGIAWLLEREPSMSSEWSIATFELLSRIVEDETITDTMREIVAARSSEPLIELPEDLRDPQLLSLRQLRPILLELDRRRRIGLPYEAPALEIQESLAAHARQLWPSIDPTQQIVLLHQLAELGIETQRSTKGILRGLVAAWGRRGERGKLLLDPKFMFGVTHLPYLATGYYQRPASAEGHLFEKEVLALASRRYVGGPLPPNPVYIDLQGELLIARKLLGVPEDSASRVLRGRLLALQNDDGSWGDPSSEQSIHATTIMVEVLSPLPRHLDPAQ